MTTTMAVKTDNKQSPWILWIILLTPILVVLSSSVLYFQGWMIPEQRSNNGILLTPPLSVADFGLPIPELTQVRHWQLIQVSPYCTDACLQRAHEQRQIHVAMGKYQTRLQRVLITNEIQFPQLAADESLSKVQQPTSVIEQYLSAVVSAEEAGQNLIFVADPFGNIMLYFNQQQDYKAQMDDLKHLLKTSTIG